jgi:hypothetical protein
MIHGLSRIVLLAGMLATGAFPIRARAQSAPGDTAGPLAVVRELFDAMRAGDSTRARRLFHPSLTHMVTSDVARDGQQRVNTGPLDGFLKAIGTPHADVYDERIYNPRVSVDGGLATIWVDYSFFLGSRFSHCGVDAMLLAKDAAGWRIISLADTRRTTGCQGQG